MSAATTSGRPSRRVVLTGAIAITGGGPLIAGLAACTPPPPAAAPPPDPLEALVVSATEDAELAEAVAAAHPPLAAAARAVAADRRVHAQALSAEVRRATPSPSSGPPVTASGSTAGGTIGSPAPADPAAARTAMLTAATGAQRQAAALVATLPRYRAGLVASIAACCASHAVVLG